MSLIAAHISSFETRTISSTASCAIWNECTPTVRTATPSAKMPTWSRVTRRPAFSDWYIASDSNGSTPMTRTSGSTALM